jgi:hypothetical protein
MNFKSEKFLRLNNTQLFNQLEDIALKLKSQLSTPGNFIVYDKQPKLAIKKFNEYFPHVTPNNPEGNKYSQNEYRWIYAFGHKKNGSIEILYVGISQTMKRRFFQHTRWKQHSTATWAYLVASHRNPSESKNARKEIIPEIQTEIMRCARYTFVQLDCNMLMQLAEVYTANKLKAFWNTFKTH